MSWIFLTRYCKKTQENEESKRRNQEIIEYITAHKVLNDKELVKSIGKSKSWRELYFLQADISNIDVII